MHPISATVKQTFALLRRTRADSQGPRFHTNPSPLLRSRCFSSVQADWSFWSVPRAVLSWRALVGDRRIRICADVGKSVVWWIFLSTVVIAIFRIGGLCLAPDTPISVGPSVPWLSQPIRTGLSVEALSRALRIFLIQTTSLVASDC